MLERERRTYHKMETTDSFPTELNTFIKVTHKTKRNEKNVRDIYERERGSCILQFLATISVGLAPLGVSAILSWTSPALPHLKSEDSEILINDTQGAWVASIYSIGAIACVPLYPILFGSAGRKPTLLILSIFQSISWIMIIFSPNVETLYVARFLSGLTGHACLKIGLIYIAEISEKDIRGSLIAIFRIFDSLGNIYIKTAGALLSYRNMNILMLLTPILFCSTFIFMPESPYFLLKQGKNIEARKHLSKLRGTMEPKILDPILKELQGAVTEDMKKGMFAFQKLFCVAGNRRSLFIILLISATLCFSGIPAIAAYTQEIFEYAELPLEPKYSTMILAGVDVPMKLLNLLVVNGIRRRFLVLTSGIISTISLATLAFYFFMKLFLCIEMNSYAWMVYLGFILYAAGMELGINITFYLMASELFSLDVKGTGLLFVTLVGNIYVLIVKSTFYWINSIVGIYTTFLIYACLCLIGSLTFFCIAPETKDKSLEEIQDIIHRRKQINEDDI